MTVRFLAGVAALLFGLVAIVIVVALARYVL